MSNSSGYTKDRYGNSVAYMPVGQTTYGHPAGLWGINCHHAPDPFVPGVSKQHDEPATDVESRYGATQRQRYYEREVRNAKRMAACYDAAGDSDAFRAGSDNREEENSAAESHLHSEPSALLR